MNYMLNAAHFIRWYTASIRSELVASVNPALLATEQAGVSY